MHRILLLNCNFFCLSTVLMWSNLYRVYHFKFLSAKGEPYMLVCRSFSEIRLNNSQPLPSEYFVKVMLVENRLYTNAAGEQNLNERTRNNIVWI